MQLSNLSVKRPVTVTMMMLIVILLGAVSLSRLGVDLYPRIDVPVAVVLTNYPDAGPEEVENLVTRPLESALSTISGVTEITSQSSEGASIIILQFDFGIDMDQASLNIRENSARIEGFLPDEASKPSVFKIDPNALPIMTLAVASEREFDITQRVLEDKVIPRIERIEGVAQVNITGLASDEVAITLDDLKMQSYNLSFNQISQRLLSENVNTAAGVIERGKKTLPLRILGEFESVSQIADLPLLLDSGQTIKLSEVADVRLQGEAIEQSITYNGAASLGLSILKTTDANTVRVAQRIQDEIDKIAEESLGLTLQVVEDNAIFINSSISNVALSGLIGGLLAVIILLLFLRNLRSTFVIAVSIPVSIIGTFALIYFAGITLNLMTLGGLALGLGMLVDNSIVVLENIFRYRELGYDRETAAIEGTKEVSMAVVASTLTTVAVFLPIVFVEGVTSLLFKELALTITFSLAASLLVALTVVPMLASKLLVVEKAASKAEQGFLKRLAAAFMRPYDAMIAFAVSHRLLTIGGAFILLMVSLALVGSLGAEFIPAMDEGTVNVSVALPESSQYSDTVDVMRTLEDQLSAIDDIENIYTQIGQDGNTLVSGANTARGSFLISLVPQEERAQTAFQVADHIRRLFRDVPGVQIEVAAGQSQGFSGGAAPISIELSGYDLEILNEYAELFIDEIEKIEGTREVSSSYQAGGDELILKIDRNSAANYGLTAAQISQTVKQMVSGVNLSAYKKDGQELTITLQGPARFSQSLNDLENMLVTTPRGNLPLSTFLQEVLIEPSPTQISRVSQARVITISAGIFERDLNSVSNEIDSALSQIPLPQGYSYEMGGETAELVESFGSLGLAFVLSIALIYMIMASQFEHVLYPFIIMFTVPLAFSGSVFGLVLTGRLISVPALIGLIMLAGIVVNNAIVLVDYTNTLRARGKTVQQAVVEASRTRLRPIMMTTLTTVLGLIPMAIGLGEGSETTAPLATVVIGGLLFSTVLTLVVIPAVYLLFNRRVVRRESTETK